MPLGSAHKKKMNRLTLAAMASAVAALPPLAVAQSTNWTGNGGNNNWATSGNWSSGLPTNGSFAYISLNTATTYNVNYNYAGAAVTLGQLEVDYSPTGTLASTLNWTASNTTPLTANTDIIGFQGGGIFIQTTGTNTLASTGVGLILGNNAGSTGTYTLSGAGSLSAAGSEEIGLSGVGTLIQSAGVNLLSNPNGTFVMGVQSTGSGNYVLNSAASLSVSGSELIGGSGTATFTQNSGTNTLAGTAGILAIGNGANSIGTYKLISGNLSTLGGEYVGNSGTGTLIQSGGSNATNDLFIANNTGSSGTYTMTGGQLSVSGIESISSGGAFTQSAGTQSVGSNGGVQVSGGTFSLSGTGSLLCQGSEIINSTATQSGGTNVDTGGNASFAIGEDSSGTYNLSGGSLTAVGTGSSPWDTGEAVGFFMGTGTLNQTGGSNASINLDLGIGVSSFSANGNYFLSGGSASFSGSVYLGGTSSGASMGTGVLVVSNTGVLNVGHTLTIYNTNSASGAVTLSGGTIETAALNFGGVPSAFTWTGGTLDLTQSVTLDSGAALTSTGTAFGSSLTLGSTQTLLIGGNETLGGTGSFALTLNSGSVHNVAGTLTVSPSGSLTQNSGSTLLAAELLQAGGAINGVVTNQGLFAYQGGLFNAQLINRGTVQLGSVFIAAGGIVNQATLAIASSQAITVNGSGLDNLGTLTLQGGTISGSGPVTNDTIGVMNASGNINNSFTNLGNLNLTGALFLNGATNANSGTIDGGGGIVGTFTNSGVINANNPSTPLGLSNFPANNGSLFIAPASTMNISTAWTNSGLVTLQGTGAELNGGAITNTTTIDGSGLVQAQVLNTAGTIRASGGELDLGGSGDTNGTAAQIQSTTGTTVLFVQGLSTNAGTIALTGGSFDNDSHAITNASTGYIAGWGTFNSGGLTNNGNINIGGSFNLFGPVNNSAAGAIHATGTGLNAFFGPVTNNGPVNIASGASVTFFNSYTGAGTVTNNGAISFFGLSNSGNITGNGTLNIGVNASATKLQLAPLGLASQQSALNLGSGSTLDVTNNLLAINYGTPAADPVASISAALISGAALNGTIDAWTGTGIVSSLAAGSNNKFTVGYLDGNNHIDAFYGSVAANQVLIAFTLGGDAFLEGSVGFRDLLSVAQDYGLTGMDYAQGNFFYNSTGSVGFADLLAVAQNYGQTFALAAAPAADQGTVSLAFSSPSAISAVPEPGSGLLALAVGGLLARRRRLASDGVKYRHAKPKNRQV